MRIKKLFFSYFIIIIPIFLLFIFVISILDRNYYMGGDLIFPLNPMNNILKSIYLWDYENGGVSFFRYMYLIWQGFFYLLSIFHIPSDIGIKLFILFLYIIGFSFTVFSYKALFQKKHYYSKTFAIIAGIFFILNPVGLLVINGYYPLYCLPAAVFFLIKFLDSKNFFFIIPFSIFVNLGYFSDLPQARNLLILLITIFFIVLIYKQLRSVIWSTLLKRLFLAGILTLFLNLFVLLPFLYDAFKAGGAVTTLAQSVTVYDGNADLHSAAIPYTSRFYNSNVVDQTRVGKFLGSKILNTWMYLLLALIILGTFVPKNKADKRIIYYLLFAFVVFIFIAKGANPPFGEVYKILLLHIPLLRVIRSASFVILGGALFYSFLLTIVMYDVYKRSKALFYIIFVIHVIIFHPLYMGYKLYSTQGGDPSYKGIKIPKEYIQMAKRLDAIKSDVKILSLPIDDGYHYADWGYSGFPFLPWFSNKPIIHSASGSVNSFHQNERIRKMSSPEACVWAGMQNIGYVVNTKDSLYNYPFNDFDVPSRRIFSDDYLMLRQVDAICQRPHVYIANKIFIYQGDLESIPSFLGKTANANQATVYIPQEGKNMSLSAVQAVQAKLIDKQLSLNPFYLKYSFDIPYKGSYSFLANNTKNILLASFNTKDIIFGDSIYPLDLGKASLTVTMKPPPNMVSDNWLDQRIGDNVNNFGPSIPLTEFSLTSKINEWEGGNTYFLSFSYKLTRKKDIGILIDEKQKVYSWRKNSSTLNMSVLQKTIPLSNLSGNYREIIKSDINAFDARIYFYNLDKDAQITDVNIQKVEVPDLFLISHPQTVITPKISFQRINPTKYLVSVSSSKSPYILNFLENFNNGWKVYVVPSQTSIKNDSIIAKYFNGDVIELNQGYDFLNLSGFLYTKPIPQDRHLMVNENANAWLITPQDTLGRESYQLLIVYDPQRIFLIGVIISFLTLIGGILFQLSKQFRKQIPYGKDQK